MRRRPLIDARSVGRAWQSMTALGLCLALIVALAANQAPMPEVKGWRDNAAKYLVRLDGTAFDPRVDTANLRCIRMNNYPCLKHPSAHPWRGTPRADGTDGARDGAGHAMFSDPKWSIVAAMQWFYRRTIGAGVRRSAYDLTQIYSPWCDTLGSVPSRVDRAGVAWGRNCGRTEGPPAGFNGPLCRKPTNDVPLPHQCDACNCPSSQADYWMRKTGHDRDEKLTLFDRDGRPTDDLRRIVPRVIAIENGHYKPNASLMSAASDAFTPQ